eukprot:CFRG2236T1
MFPTMRKTAFFPLNFLIRVVGLLCFAYTITHLILSDGKEATDTISAISSAVSYYTVKHASSEPIVLQHPESGGVNEAGFDDNYYAEYRPSSGGDLRIQFEKAYQQSQAYGIENYVKMDSYTRADFKNKYLFDKTTHLMDDSYPTGKVTLVSGLWDLGRGDLKGNDFKRPFSEYIEGLKSNLLQSKMAKVLFIPQQLAEELREHVRDNTVNLRIVPLELDAIEKWYGESYGHLQAIRTNKDWSDLYGENGWLAKSPQSTLKNYNPVVMYKIFMLRIAARINPFNTRSFLFVDAKHICMNPQDMKDENMSIMKEHMRKFLVTHFFYGPSGETHGFINAEFMKWLNLPEQSQHKVCRGGIFGGKRESIEAVAAAFENVMRLHLKDGFMGTEENIFSILLYRYPHLFRPFNNDNSCVDSEEPDHTCPGFINTANFCAIFDWAYYGGPARNGGRVKFVAPDEGVDFTGNNA